MSSKTKAFNFLRIDVNRSFHYVLTVFWIIVFLVYILCQLLLASNFMLTFPTYYSDIAVYSFIVMGILLGGHDFKYYGKSHKLISYTETNMNELNKKKKWILEDMHPYYDIAKTENGNLRQELFNILYPASNEKKIYIIALIRGINEIDLIDSIQKIFKEWTVFLGKGKDTIVQPEIKVYSFIDWENESHLTNETIVPQIKGFIEKFSCSWHYIPYIPTFWDITIVANDTNHYIGFDSSAQGTLSYSSQGSMLSRRMINRAIQYCEEYENTIVFSIEQIKHYSRLKDRINKLHIDDYHNFGLNFGQVSKIVRPDFEELYTGPHLYKDHKEVSIKDKSEAISKHINKVIADEGESYSAFAEEILEYESKIATFWPLFNQSLMYAGDKDIDKWQEKLNESVIKRKAKKVTRYLGYLCENPNKVIEDYKIVDKDMGEIVLNYKLVLEFVIARYFYSMLSEKNYELYLIPIDYNKGNPGGYHIGDNLWNYIEREIDTNMCIKKYIDKKGTDKKEKEIKDDIRKSFLLRDWVHFNIEKPLNISLLQHEAVHDVLRCREKKCTEGGREKDCLEPISEKFCIHKYIVNSSNIPMCNSQQCGSQQNGECKINNYQLLLFCCLQKALESALTTTNDYRPFELKISNNENPLAEVIADKIKINLTNNKDYYKKPDEGGGNKMTEEKTEEMTEEMTEEKDKEKEQEKKDKQTIEWLDRYYSSQKKNSQA